MNERARRRKPFMIMGSILMALVLIVSGFAWGLSLLLSVIILGITNSMVPPLIMTMPSEILSQSYVGIGFGILMVCQNIGIMFGPPLAGYLLASTESMELTLIGMAMFLVLGSFVAATLKTG